VEKPHEGAALGKEKKRSCFFWEKKKRGCTDPEKKNALSLGVVISLSTGTRCKGKKDLLEGIDHGKDFSGKKTMYNKVCSSQGEGQTKRKKILEELEREDRDPVRRGKKKLRKRTSRFGTKEILPKDRQRTKVQN